MVEQGSGRIVFVTSISANTASANRGEYCIFESRPGIIRTDMISAVEDIYEKRSAAWAKASQTDRSITPPAYTLMAGAYNVGRGHALPL